MNKKRTEADTIIYIVHEGYFDDPKLVAMHAKREPTRYRILQGREAIGYHTFLGLDDARVRFTKKAAIDYYLDTIEQRRKEINDELDNLAKRAIAAQRLH